MKRLLSLVFSAVVILGLLSGCGGKEDKVGSNEAAAFSVGYGQVDITPAGNVALTGFGDADERLSTRVTEPLYATCIAVKDAAGDTVLIVAYDLINCAEAWSIPTRQAVSEATGVPYDHVMLHSSHTHSGPDIAKMPPYQNEVKAKTVEAAQAAMADLAPATMSGSYTRVEERSAASVTICSLMARTWARAWAPCPRMNWWVTPGCLTICCRWSSLSGRTKRTS